MNAVLKAYIEELHRGKRIECSNEYRKVRNLRGIASKARFKNVGAHPFYLNGQLSFLYIIDYALYETP